MNLLIEKLPKTVWIGGAEVPINWGFRTSVKFEILMQSDVEDKDKFLKGLQLYYGDDLPENINGAIEQMLWFYQGGDHPETSKKGAQSRGNGKQAYSFEYDDDYLYAAFLDQYGIDLNEIEDLHWWKFRALMKSLRKDMSIVEIMGYRTVKIDSKMNKEQQKFYADMQRIYEIPMKKSKQLEAIEEALLKGESIEGLL